MKLERIGPFEYRRHAPRLPGLSGDGREPGEHRVVIAGGGPVGLAVAVGLGRWGISSVVIEADDSVCEGSRAACISRRSLEILDRFGVVGPVVEKGLPWSRGRSYYGTDEVFLLEMEASPGDRFPPMVNLEQYYIEQYLLDAIDGINARTPGLIDVRWASKVVALECGVDRVEVEIQNSLGRYRCGAAWLVACDGGQSFVRSSLGLELRGVGYQGRYAIVDIELASDHPTERRAWFDPPWVRGGTVLMHRQPDNIWRIDYQLHAREDAADVMQPERIRAIVQSHLDAIGEGHLPWKPVWTSIYRAGAMTLDSYRHGRILFAGNAAHAMPIFGVRGLNSGFDDADNLVWKLAAVLREEASESLLDSYSVERVQAFHINAESAMRSTEFMSPPSRGFELMREAALSLAAGHRDIANLVSPRQTHAITYEAPAISSPGDRFEAGPGPGAPLRDMMTESGTFLTERLAEHAFTLLCFGHGDRGRQVQAATDAATWKLLRCRSVELDATGQVARAYGATDGSAYLVRPDGHVADRWRRPGVDTVLDAIRRFCETETEEI